VASTDLTTAKSLDATNCVAVWYLALVALKRETWLTAADQFAVSMDCYASTALENEQRMRETAERTDLDPAWRAEQLAGFDLAIQEARGQASASAYNAAVNFLRAGDRPKAVMYADLAARDPLRLQKVEELKPFLK
jgi:hypothetical protein